MFIVSILPVHSHIVYMSLVCTLHTAYYNSIDIIKAFCICNIENDTVAIIAVSESK